MVLCVTSFTSLKKIEMFFLFVTEDPNETKNLALDPAYADILADIRAEADMYSNNQADVDLDAANPVSIFLLVICANQNLDSRI